MSTQPGIIMTVGFGLRTGSCAVCGAIVYAELTGPGEERAGVVSARTGEPSDHRAQHAEWHERTGL
jgi:hypothetical protein